MRIPLGHEHGAFYSSRSPLEHWMYSRELDTASHLHEFCSSLSGPHLEEQGMYSQELGTASHPRELYSSLSSPHLEQQGIYSRELDTTFASTILLLYSTHLDRTPYHH
jgi:hypothetical protein